MTSTIYQVSTLRASGQSTIGKPRAVSHSKAGDLKGRKVSPSPSRILSHAVVLKERSSPSSPTDFLKTPPSAYATTSDDSSPSSSDSVRSVSRLRAGSDPAKRLSGSKNGTISQLQLGDGRASLGASKPSTPVPTDHPGAVLRMVSLALPLTPHRGASPLSHSRELTSTPSSQMRSLNRVLDDEGAAKHSRKSMEHENKSKPKETMRIGSINATYDPNTNTFELKGQKSRKTQPTQSDSDHIRGAYPKLARLNLHYCHLTEEAVKALPRYTHLTVLDLTGSEMDAGYNNLKWLESLPKLQELILASWKKISLDGSITHALRNLEVLDLSNITELSEDDINQISRFKSLRELSISKSKKDELAGVLERLRSGGVKIIEKSNGKRKTEVPVAGLSSSMQGLSLSAMSSTSSTSHAALDAAPSKAVSETALAALSNSSLDSSASSDSSSHVTASSVVAKSSQEGSGESLPSVNIPLPSATSSDSQTGTLPAQPVAVQLAAAQTTTRQPVTSSAAQAQKSGEGDGCCIIL